MEVVAALAIVALVASNVLWLRAYEKLARTTTDERRELLTRITHPEFIPVPADKLPPDAEMLTADTDDEYETVGTIAGGPHLDLVEGDANANGDAA